MKQKFVKKALAVVLSTAMTFSLSSAAHMQTASAAKKFVGLNTTFKTLKVGQSNYKLKLTNNTIGWKVTKAVSTDKSIVAVQKKAASYVTLKGKSAGRATIRVSLKTAARKTNNTKTLRCRVKVVETGTTTPTTPEPTTPSVDPVQSTAKVTTQTELDAALKNTAVTSITIDTTAAASFKIPSGQYNNVDLTVNAPNADVENSATFKSVTIKAIKNDTWTEKARGNSLRVEALKARVVVDAAASVAGITVTSANADIAIVVNGTAAGITVSAKAKLNLTGSATAKVPVTIAAAATGSELISAIPVILQAAANATIDLLAGAEESTVQVTSPSATVSVKNNTTKKITVTKADNSKSDVAAKGNLTVKPSTGTSTGSTGGSSSWGGGSWIGGGSSSGSNTVKDYVSVANQTELDAALKDSAIKEITIRNATGTLYINAKDSNDNYISYSKDLIVDSPEATIENYSDFRSIRILNIASSTWREFAQRNNFTITAPNPHFVVGKGAKVGKISFLGSVKKAELEVHGTIENGVSCASNEEDANIIVRTAEGAEVKGGVQVNAKIQVDVVGAATENKIEVTVNAAGATLVVKIPVAIKLTKNDSNIQVKAGAEGSSLEFASNVEKTLINTEVKVDKIVDGQTTEIPAGAEGEVKADSDEVNEDVPVPPVEGADDEMTDNGEETTPPTEDNSSSTGDGTEGDTSSTGDGTEGDSSSTGDGTEGDSSSSGDGSTSTGVAVSGFKGIVTGGALIVTAGAITVDGKGATIPEKASFDGKEVSFANNEFKIEDITEITAEKKLTFDITSEDGKKYTITITIPANLSTTEAVDLDGTGIAASE
ncbi:MAG: hypothetical protein HFH34_00005 [Eubacterium sp.]|nr:hypothetical protein [Eubacterium sp.]